MFEKPENTVVVSDNV